ncbi:hypothetical protein JW758_05865 [Candidatus Peregrinibacteria bacterium]|nr:hypothetical protein [Candidatus Peregrinibacteria bacterium]
MTEENSTPHEEEKEKVVETAVPESDVETQAGAQDLPSKDEEKKEEVIEEMTTLHERTIAALSYIGFFAIVPFYLKKESKFCRFHGKQGMLVAIIFFSLSLFQVLGLIMDIVLITQFVIFIYMGFGALSGKWKKLPFIYEASCRLEEALTLKTKEEEADSAALKAGEINEEADEPNQAQK